MICWLKTGFKNRFSSRKTAVKPVRVFEPVPRPMQEGGHALCPVNVSRAFLGRGSKAFPIHMSGHRVGTTWALSCGTPGEKKHLYCDVSFLNCEFFTFVLSFLSNNIPHDFRFKRTSVLSLHDSMML